MPSRIARALPAPAALAVLTLIVAPVRADHASRHFDVSGKPALTVVTDDANVHVHPGPPGQIDIELETRGWNIGSGGLKVVAEQDGNRVRYEVREPHGWFVFNLRVNRHIEMDLRVPPDLDLDLNTGDGGVTIEDVSGDIRLRSGDGNIDAKRLHGNLVIESGDGRVEATDLDGRLRAHSGDGHVKAEGRFDELEIGTGDGPVEVDARPRSAVAGEWRVTTGDGPVTLRLPRDLRADLDIHSGDGGISTDLSVEVSGTISRGSLRGRLNGGGERIYVHTGDGSIRVVGS